MDLDELSYSKESKDKLLRNPVAVKYATKVLGKPTLPSNNVPAAYQKQEGELDQRLIFVLSGGEKKERQIFKELIEKEHYVKVLFFSEKGQGLLPSQMLEEWKKIQASKLLTNGGKQYQLADIDKVFLVSDAGDFYGELVAAIKVTSPTDQAVWIVSNPCIETWLYYCYKNDPLSDLGEVAGFCVLKRSQRMKSLCDRVIAGGMDPRKAFLHLDDGIKHSRKLYEEDENGIPKLFSTQMFRMMEYIQTTMNQRNNEYSNYITQQQQIREQWRRGSATIENSHNKTGR